MNKLDDLTKRLDSIEWYRNRNSDLQSNTSSIDDIIEILLDLINEIKKEREC